MRFPVLLLLLLLTVVSVRAQSDSTDTDIDTVDTEVRTGKITVKKRKTTLFIRTEISFNFIDDVPVYRNAGGLRIGIIKKKHQIIDRKEYVMVNPEPMIDSVEVPAFDFTRFFRENLEYTCPSGDTGRIDSIQISLFIEPTGECEFSIVEDFTNYDSTHKDPCKKIFKKASITVLNRLKVWVPGGMLLSDGRVINRTTYGKLKIYVAIKPFTPKDALNNEEKSGELIKN